MSVEVKNAIHDSLLTAHGYMPAWDDYDIIGVARKTEGGIKIFNQFYERLASLKFLDGYSWGSFYPDGTPEDNWYEWAEEAGKFLSDRDKYVNDIVGNLRIQSDWTDINVKNGAKNKLPFWHKDVVDGLDLCGVYEYYWPKVMMNYRSLEGMMAVCDASIHQDVMEKAAHNKKYLEVASPARLITPLKEGERPPCVCCLD